MSTRSTTTVGLIVSILIIGAIASIGYYQFEVAPNAGSTSSTSPTTTAASCTPSTCIDVSIIPGASTSSGGFSPGTITVVLGHNATVIWTNNDTVPHTVYVKTGAPKTFDSGNLAPGAVFQHTFDVAGTYTYGCDYHPSMLGTVIVKS